MKKKTAPSKSDARKFVVDDDRHAAHLQRVESSANVGLHKIIEMLAATHKEIDEWLRQHGATCPCSFCHNKSAPKVLRDVGAVIEHDLRGAQWAIEAATGILKGERLGEPPTAASIQEEIAAASKQ